MSLSLCDGLAGLIQANNQTLLLEPVHGDPSFHHVLYPLTQRRIDLTGDQDFGNLTRRRKRGVQQVDYDEDGNEVVDTVHLEEEPVEYDLKEEEDEINEIEDEDDEAIISDSYSEIEDYDVHPPPAVIEATTLEEAERTKEEPRLNSTVDSNDVVDGYSVDKLWEGLELFYIP